MSFTVPVFKEMPDFGSIFHGTSQDIFHGSYNVNFMQIKCEYSGTSLLRTLWDLKISPYYRGFLNSEVT